MTCTHGTSLKDPQTWNWLAVGMALVCYMILYVGITWRVLVLWVCCYKIDTCFPNDGTLISLETKALLFLLQQTPLNFLVFWTRPISSPTLSDPQDFLEIFYFFLSSHPLTSVFVILTFVSLKCGTPSEYNTLQKPLQ